VLVGFLVIPTLVLLLITIFFAFLALFHRFSRRGIVEFLALCMGALWFSWFTIVTVAFVWFVCFRRSSLSWFLGFVSWLILLR
jgi:hypothetical protein